MEFNDQQLFRYARHIILDEVGEEGQAKLLASKVLVIGAGGLGSPLLMYLAAAGVGTLGIVDDDVVELSNLQRQIVHSTASIGMAKVLSAKKTVAEVNPEVRLIPYETRLTEENAREIIQDYDLIADGSDNFDTRYLLNDACHLARRPLVSGALLRFEGQISTFKSWLEGNHPCYRCIFPEPPPPDLIPRCEQAGILGALAGVVGSIQATEALKELLGIGESLSGSLLIYDALAATFHRINVKRDPACPLCGRDPTIKDLSGHIRQDGDDA
ncbi:MAG: molybdopterin-synthase adenylyltransferase MoeB [Proteobacteria bacterium]|nr:molybdopterin-synthase adenylyltransferase MoeB [Pseudomonadota bacterium]